MKRAMETWEKERILFKCILQKGWTHVLQVRDWWRKALVNTAMNLFLTSRVSNSLTIPRPGNEISRTAVQRPPNTVYYSIPLRPPSDLY